MRKIELRKLKAVTPQANTALIFILLIIIVFITYYPAITDFPIADDLAFIKPYTWNELGNYFVSGWGWCNFFRPLIRVWFAFDYLLWQEFIPAYHISNIAMHVLVCLLIYLVSKQLLKNQSAAFLAAAIFALHPQTIYSVSWISGRTDILCAFFYLLGLWCFNLWLDKSGNGLRCYRSTTGNKGLLMYSGVLICFIFALGCKEIAVTFPFSLTLFYYFRKRKQILFARGATVAGDLQNFNFQEILKVFLPLLVIQVLYGWLRFLIFSKAPYQAGYQFPENFSILAFNIFKSIALLFRAFLIGWESKTAIFLTSLLLLCCSIFNSQILFCLLWSGILSLPIIHLASWRLIYLPVIPITIILAYLWSYLQKLFLSKRSAFRQYISFIPIIGLVGFSGYLTYQSNLDWKESARINKNVVGSIKNLYPTFAQESHLYFLEPANQYGKAFLFPHVEGLKMALEKLYKDTQFFCHYLPLEEYKDIIFDGKHFVFQIDKDQVLELKNLMSNAYSEKLLESPYQLKKDTPIGQSFLSRFKNLSRIDVLLGTYRKTLPANIATSSATSLKLNIKDNIESTQILVSADSSGKYLFDNLYHAFEFEPIFDSENRSFYFEIEVNPTLSNLCAVWASNTDRYQAGSLFLDHQEQPSDISFQAFSKVPIPEKFHVGEIYGSDRYIQSLAVPSSNLKSFKLYLATFQRTNFQDIDISVSSDLKGEDFLIQHSLNASLISDNSWFSFSLPDPPLEVGQQIFISVSSEKSKPGDAITLWIHGSTAGNNGQLFYSNSQRYLNELPVVGETYLLFE